MISDLAGKGTIRDSADVIVIGAGTVGLPISVLLARKAGMRVVCLESGALHQDGETHPLNDVIHVDNEYRGAAVGRYRCLGGTSTRWGGALIPFQRADMGHGDWPITADELEPYVSRTEQLFDLEVGPYADTEFPFDLGTSHVNRLAKWPIFKHRNVVGLVGSEARRSHGLAVWLDATVTEITEVGAGQGVEVVARSQGGDVIRIDAPRLLIAAGAIETTRLALLMDRQNGGRVSDASPSLGRCFSDHIGMVTAEVDPIDMDELTMLFGWRFGRAGTIRNIRFELAPDCPARADLLPSFTYLSPSSASGGGFVALREIYRHVQRRKAPTVGSILDLGRHLPWLTRAAWWRYARKRLVFPDNQPLKVCVNQEQALDERNVITLSDSKNDSFGVPLAKIAWRPRPIDVENLIRSGRMFAETWSSTQLSRSGRLRAYSEEQIRGGVLESGGVFHPTSSTRMGRDSSCGVVDRDLRVFAMPQVQLVSTSVLPTGGGANPTMMAIMLGIRCVDQILGRATS